MDPRVDERMELELYKSLRAEAAGYIEKIPALWSQKFLLVGATVTFSPPRCVSFQCLQSWSTPAFSSIVYTLAQSRLSLKNTL